MNDNIRVVVENELCSGCGTCYAICPKKSISMTFSPIGRILPVVDENTCINCGVCYKVCPGIDMTGDFSAVINENLVGQFHNIYFARSANELVFNNAQSGGSVTETLLYMFDEKIIDAALVVVQDNQLAKYILATSSEDLKTSQASQYTPIDLVSGISLTKNYKHVAIVGLPCHVEGIVKLKQLFPSKYNNIDYLLGLICAGCLSQSIVDVVKNVGGKRIGPISDEEIISWRQKKYSSYNNANIAIINGEGKVRLLDNNIRFMAKPKLTAPRCKLCFDKMNMCADVVYGDAWGITGDDVSIGGNVIVTRTQKGDILINQLFLNKRIVGRPCPVEEVIKGQGLKEKKAIVSEMLAIYREKNYMMPGWSACDLFNDNKKQYEDLLSQVDDYLKLDKATRRIVVKTVSSRINRKLRIIELKRFVKKLLIK